MPAASGHKKSTPGIQTCHCGYYGSPLHRMLLGLTPFISLGARNHLLRLREDKSLRTHSGCVKWVFKLPVVYCHLAKRFTEWVTNILLKRCLSTRRCGTRANAQGGKDSIKTLFPLFNHCPLRLGEEWTCHHPAHHGWTRTGQDITPLSQESRCTVWPQTIHTCRE